MASIDLNGIAISYEIVGSGDRNLVVTPGGRYSKDIDGLGGPIGLSVLPFAYCADLAQAAACDGMAAVADLPVLREQMERNSGNRNRLLALDSRAFVNKMFAWSSAFFPEPGSPVPGIRREQLAAIHKPVMILRSSRMDMHHTRETSETVHALIPGAQIAEPPWDEREWPRRMAGFMRGESAATNWPALAPQITAFARSEVPA